MGGDFGPSVTVPACIKALQQHPDLFLVLVGSQTQIEPLLKGMSASTRERLSIVHTEVAIDEESPPGSVLRKYKDSSMYLAVSLVKDGLVAACVSAGGTGALLLTGRHLLKTISGIGKPAIIASIPVLDSEQRCYLLDVGADLTCDASQLYQYAVMGSVLDSVTHVRENPRIALLNVGHEEHKGTDQIRQAAQILENTEGLNYVGFIESNEVFIGKADVIVCDGFSGNVLIKSSAGLVRVIESLFHDSVQRNLFYRILGLLAAPLLRPLRERIDPSQFNGASVVGLQGIIVKSHGNANTTAFGHAIEEALNELSNNLPELIRQKIIAMKTINVSGAAVSHDIL
jgi:glycerol-3-phosphate acyltransferase PlsX